VNIVKDMVAAVFDFFREVGRAIIDAVKSLFRAEPVKVRTPSRPLVTMAGVRALDALVLEGCHIQITYSPPAKFVSPGGRIVDEGGWWVVKIGWPDRSSLAWGGVTLEQVLRYVRSHVATKGGHFDRPGS